jgi:hypothetical protein
VAFTPYATLPEFKAWVTLTDTVDDVVLNDCLLSASQWIDGYCDTHFWQDGTVGSPVARTFTACTNGCRCIDIDDLVSISTLKTDDSGDGVYETTWSASDYQLQPVNRPNGEPYTNVEAVGTLTFPARTAPGSRANRIEITGVWGWAAVPAPVRRACLIEASKELKRRFSPEGVAGFGEFGLVRISSKPVDPTVEAMLDDYTRTARGTGVLIA